MFTQHLIKNCLWLFAAVQCFSPPQLSRFLVVVMTTFMLQIGFVNGVFAEDVTTTTATDATTAATDTVVVDEQTLLKTSQDLFSMSMQNDTDGLLISITGIIPSQIDRIFFDGSDVTELVDSFVKQGIAKVTETENSYTLNVTLSPQIEGEHTLTISTVEGTLLSKKVTLTRYEVNKGSRIDPMKGGWGSAARIKKSGAWMSEVLSKPFTITYYSSKISGKYYTVKATITDSKNGYYTASCDSTVDKNRSTVTDSGFCYDADMAYCTHVDNGRVYQSGVVRLAAAYFVASSSCPVMVNIPFVRDWR